MSEPWFRRLLSARRSRTHAAGGMVNLADGLRQEPSPALDASKTGRARKPAPARGLWVSYVLVAAAVAIGYLASCPRARANDGEPAPAPTLPARLPTLEEQLADLDRLEARLLAGREIVARAQALAFHHDPAVALGLNGSRGLAAGRRPGARSGSAAGAAVFLGSTVTAKASAGFEARAGSSVAMNVDPLPGVADRGAGRSLREGQRPGRPHEPTAPGAAPGPAIEARGRP